LQTLIGKGLYGNCRGCPALPRRQNLLIKQIGGRQGAKSGLGKKVALIVDSHRRTNLDLKTGSSTKSIRRVGGCKVGGLS